MRMDTSGGMTAGEFVNGAAPVGGGDRRRASAVGSHTSEHLSDRTFFLRLFDPGGAAAAGHIFRF